MAQVWPIRIPYTSGHSEWSRDGQVNGQLVKFLFRTLTNTIRIDVFLLNG